MTEFIAHIIANIEAALANDIARKSLQVVGILFAAFVATKLLAALPPVRRLDAQHRLVVRRLASVLAAGLAIVGALNVIGVGVGVLLGTAGVLTVAFGFAAQTSMSNLISGFFLMAERPFRVGDVIEVGGSHGEVISIELLSVRLRTFDNLMIRLANEDVLKSPVVNYTHFPLRRIDAKVRVPVESDTEAIAAIAPRIVDSVAEALVEPTPTTLITGVDHSGLDVQLSIWTTSASFVRVRNAVYAQLMTELAAVGVEPAVPKHQLQLLGEAPRIG